MFTYSCYFFMVNVGKDTIPGRYEYGYLTLDKTMRLDKHHSLN